jgi:hypothetical protein
VRGMLAKVADMHKLQELTPKMLQARRPCLSQGCPPQVWACQTRHHLCVGCLGPERARQHRALLQLLHRPP